MKKEYSFNEISQIGTGYPQTQNRALPQPNYTTNKQNKDPWTDLRVVEIKKKYDTPSHRKIGSNCAGNDRYREHQQEIQRNSACNSYRNALRESMELPSAIKRDQNLSLNNYIPLIKEDNTQKRNQKRNWQECQYISKFTTLNKENTMIADKFVERKASIKSLKDIKNFHELVSAKICPRVENIEKLNMKIKKVLDNPTSHFNYNQNTTIEKGILKHQTRNLCMDGFLMGRGQSDEQFQQTKLLCRQKFANEREIMNPTKRYSLQFDDTHETTSKWKLQEKYNKIKTSQGFFHEDIHEESQQIDSFLDLNQQSENINNKRKSCKENFKQTDIELHSGKKLNDEITKIATRIKQFQQQKKKLNIEFIPYTEKPPLNKSINILTEPNCDLNQHTESITGCKTKGSEIISSHSTFDNIHPKFTNWEEEFESKPPVDDKNVQHYEPLERMNNVFKIDILESVKLQKKQKQDNCSFQEKQSQSIYESIPLSIAQNPCSSDLQHKTEQGIEERKRKLLDTATVTFSRQTKKLIANLFQQVKLDEDLRNSKIWFRDLLDFNKTEILKVKAEKANVQIRQSEIKVTEEQDNPFYSIEEKGQNYDQLVENWIAAETYWKQNIAGQFDIKEFQIEKFTNEKVDLEKKGYFVVEDLVRFLNMETGTFYRNRDLILIFRRLSSRNKLHWQQFLTILSKHS